MTSYNMATIKEKKCKQCWKEFTPSSSLNNCCSFKCYDKYKTEKDKAKKKMQREAKKVSVSVLSKQADKVFSEYIRKRDALKTTGWIEKITCSTCKETKDYSQFDCWHFVWRASRSTRWEEKNCTAQCKVCNNWWWWRQYEHWKEIDRRHWEWTADLLIKIWHEPQKVTSDWLQGIISKYKEKLEIINNSL